MKIFMQSVFCIWFLPKNTVFCSHFLLCFVLYLTNNENLSENLRIVCVSMYNRIDDAPPYRCRCNRLQWQRGGLSTSFFDRMRFLPCHITAITINGHWNNGLWGSGNRPTITTITRLTLSPSKHNRMALSFSLDRILE